jgi:hypothetical protein
MKAFWISLQTATGMGRGAPWIALAFVLACIALLAWDRPQRRRVVTSLLLFLVAGAFLLTAAAMLIDGISPDAQAYHWVRFVGLLLLTVAVINVAAVLLFDVILTAIRLRPPDIVRDLLIAVAYIAATISLLSLIGVNLTGIVATSAS